MFNILDINNISDISSKLGVCTCGNNCSNSCNFFKKENQFYKYGLSFEKSCNNCNSSSCMSCNNTKILDQQNKICECNECVERCTGSCSCGGK